MKQPRAHSSGKLFLSYLYMNISCQAFPSTVLFLPCQPNFARVLAKACRCHYLRKDAAKTKHLR